MALDPTLNVFPHPEIKKLNDECAQTSLGIRPLDVQMESKLCEQYQSFLEAGFPEGLAQATVAELIAELSEKAATNCITERQLIHLRDAGHPVEGCEDFYREYDRKAEKVAQGFVESLTCLHAPLDVIEEGADADRDPKEA